jgi:hypothetical protein
MNRQPGGSPIRTRDCRIVKPEHPQPDAAIVRRIDMSLLIEELARDRMREMHRDLELSRRIRRIRARRRSTSQPAR